MFLDVLNDVRLRSSRSSQWWPQHSGQTRCVGTAAGAGPGTQPVLPLQGAVPWEARFHGSVCLVTRWASFVWAVTLIGKDGKIYNPKTFLEHDAAVPSVET